jgi:hypothetical protein
MTWSILEVLNGEVGILIMVRYACCLGDLVGRNGSYQAFGSFMDKTFHQIFIISQLSDFFNPAFSFYKALIEIIYHDPFVHAPSRWENHINHCSSGRRYWERDDKENNKRRQNYTRGMV